MLEKLRNKRADVILPIAILMLSVGVLTVVQAVRTGLDGTLKKQGKKIACAHRGDKVCDLE